MQIKSNCNEIIHATPFSDVSNLKHFSMLFFLSKLKSNVVYKSNILIKNEKKYQKLKNI